MPYISLNKTEFYKDDYASTGKIPITGSISGLDPSKQYCIMWTCNLCTSDYLFHSPTTEYFYIKNVSSISIGSGSHLHENLINYGGHDSSDVMVFLNEVNGNCETIRDEFIEYKYITVYNKYKPVAEGNADIKGLNFRNASGSIITEAEEGETVYAYYTIKNTIGVEDTFYSYAEINGKNVSDEKFSLGSYASKTFRIASWTMGSSNMKFEVAGGHDVNGNVIVDDIESKTLYVKEVIATATLSCNTTPTGAKIYLNDIYQGLTNKTIYDLTPGTYTVRYELNGYETYTKTTTINAGQISYVTTILQTEPELVGTLNCNSNPSGAEIWINGSNTGEVTPKAFINMPVKRHEVKFKKTDYHDYSDIFDVREGETTNVFATLVSSVEEPTCIDYTTQQECEANDCYWHSDNTCQEMPEGATEYFDIGIKPYSTYEGRYEEAVSKAVEASIGLTGKLANYISSLTGYDYIGMEIREDVNKQLIIVRIFLRSTNETSLAIPAVIVPALIAIVVTSLLLVGLIVWTSHGDLTKEEAITIMDDAADKAIEACKERYPNRLTSKIEAKAYADCVGGVDTTRIIATSDITDEDPADAIDLIDEEIEYIGNGLNDGTIDPSDIDKVVDETITTPIKIIVDDQKETAVSEDCAWEIAGECIITKKAAKNIALVAIGLGGLMALSTVKDIVKR